MSEATIVPIKKKLDFSNKIYNHSINADTDLLALENEVLKYSPAFDKETQEIFHSQAWKIRFSPVHQFFEPVTTVIKNGRSKRPPWDPAERTRTSHIRQPGTQAVISVVLKKLWCFRTVHSAVPVLSVIASGCFFAYKSVAPSTGLPFTNSWLPFTLQRQKNNIMTNNHKVSHEVKLGKRFH